MNGSTALRREQIKRRIAQSSYEVDPRQVAAAVIVKLVLEGGLPRPRGSRNGASHSSDVPFRGHRAA
jgi:hypothetical protein